jgi:hypothetical protein
MDEVGNMKIIELAEPLAGRRGSSFYVRRIRAYDIKLREDYGDNKDSQLFGYRRYRCQSFALARQWAILFSFSTAIWCEESYSDYFSRHRASFGYAGVHTHFAV